MLKAYQQRQHLPVEQAQGNPILSTLGTVAGTAAGAAIGGPPGAAIGASIGSQLGNVAAGAPVDPAQMAMAGLSSGMSAGTNAAGAAAKGLETAKSNMLSEMAKTGATEASASQIKAIQDAAAKSMAADSSLFNDPFGKAARQVKSVFMAEGGEVYKSPLEKFSSMKSGDRDKMLMMGALPLIMQNPEMFGGLGTMFLNKGGEVKQSNKSKLKRDKDGKLILPDNIDFSKLQPMSEAEKRQRAALDQQTRSAAYKAQGGPLCSKCEAEYKACGGMTKKRY